MGTEILTSCLPECLSRGARNDNIIIQFNTIGDLYLLVPLTPPSTSIDHKPGLETVAYSDIPERVQIIGKLKQPLGKLVTVHGRWTASFPSKPASPVFVVDSVNGNILDPQAEFDVVEPVLGKGGEVTKKAIGEEWELRGVETGGFVGFNDKVWEENLDSLLCKEGHVVS
jgi:hypothetical protein